MNTNNHNRREFIKASVIGAAGITIGGAGFSAKESHNVQVRAICDTDEALLPPTLKLVEEKSAVKPAANWDLRVILDDKEIHAVAIVTPNHWHALAAIWASQAGKDVYVEKPASHNIWEGRKRIEAWRKYGRRMHVGLNNRSATNVREAIAFLRIPGSRRRPRTYPGTAAKAKEESPMDRMTGKNLTKESGAAARVSAGESDFDKLRTKIQNCWYLPVEDLDEDEIRISFMGTNYAGRPGQSMVSVFIETGDGDSFVFDCGCGVISRYTAMGVPSSRMRTS